MNRVCVKVSYVWTEGRLIVIYSMKYKYGLMDFKHSHSLSAPAPAKHFVCWSHITAMQRNDSNCGLMSLYSSSVDSSTESARSSSKR
jgi:hypothetical protein